MHYMLLNRSCNQQLDESGSRNSSSLRDVPSDPRDAVRNGYAQGSYSGVLGSQRVPSANGSCNTWLSENVNYMLTGTADHGNDINTSNRWLLRSPWTADPFSFNYRRTSNTFLVGEVLMDCTDHTAVGGITTAETMLMHQRRLR